MSPVDRKQYWLVAGLRPYTPRRLDWSEAIVRRVLNQLDQETSGEKARLAHAGLGLPDSCYWYVHRADEAYSEAIFFFDDDRAGWRGNITAEGAAYPFDTGGVWHGHLQTTSPMIAPVQLLASHQKSLDVWRSSFDGWLAQHYTSSGWTSYVEGDAPSPGVVAWSPGADSRGWTWEVRVVRTAANRLAPKRLFINERDLELLWDWVDDQPPSSAISNVREWLSSTCVEPCEDPFIAAMTALRL